MQQRVGQSILGDRNVHQTLACRPLRDAAWGGTRQRFVVESPLLRPIAFHACQGAKTQQPHGLKRLVAFSRRLGHDTGVAVLRGAVIAELSGDASQMRGCKRARYEIGVCHEATDGRDRCKSHLETTGALHVFGLDPKTFGEPRGRIFRRQIPVPDKSRAAL